MKRLVTPILLALAYIAPGYGAPADDVNTLLWEVPAPQKKEEVNVGWYNANPIGNGRLGGMVYGGIDQERIHINEDTFWSGEPRQLQKPDAHKRLKDVRDLLFKNDAAGAQHIMDTEWLGPYNECYMPVSDLMIDFENTDVPATDYKRELNMREGIVTVTYKRGDVTYKREYFVSHPDQALIVRLSADKKGALNFSTYLKTQQEIAKVQTHKNNLLETGEAPVHASPHYLGVIPPVYKEGNAMRFAAHLTALNEGGELVTETDKLTVKGADAVTLVLTVATSFNGYDKHPAKEGKDEKVCVKKDTDKVLKKSYDQLKEAHVKDFSSFYDRFSIDLGGNETANKPITNRIGTFYKPEEDAALTAQYLQFGRYMTISASRPGTNSMYLQGIWNKDMQPAWSCNYTLNCNAEIVYWGTELVNLSELHTPIAELTREASVDGAKTAKALYNIDKGWIIHHNLDIWRTTWPVGGSGSWAMYNMGGAWLCHHIWEHYAFSLDKDFLKKYYPTMKGCAEFFLEYLVPDKDGYLVTGPSVSFEHGYVRPDGGGGWACMGPAQDMQILRTLFKNMIAAGKILGEDDAFLKKMKTTHDKLAPAKISPTTGFLQEWNDDWQPGHPQDGQIAHSWGMAVGADITLRGTPELAEAFRKDMNFRKINQGGNSGSWPGAFAINSRVRLGEGDEAQDVLNRHFTHAVANNFWSHFAGTPQLDGTLGMMAGITQMFFQSQTGELDLLPAVPTKYPKGEIKGLRGKGAVTVDVKWDAGKLVEAKITSDKGGIYPVYNKDFGSTKVTLKAGESKTLTPDSFKK